MQYYSMKEGSFEDISLTFNKFCLKITNNIEEFSLSIVNSLMGVVEKYKIKGTIRTLKKEKLVSQPSSIIQGFGKTRLKFYRSEFKSCLKDIEAICNDWYGWKDNEKREKYMNDFSRRNHVIKSHFEEKLKKYFKECENDEFKKINISKETLEELENEINIFKSAIDEFTNMGIDTIRKIEKIAMKSREDYVIKLCQKETFTITSITQRVITDYMSYAYKLVQTFKNIQRKE